ncbi:hypothetical protein [Azospirillum sp. B4]|uniref:hypothetical protein n=1 Tax=Azospirillum sp. B4 TaxID=95605 RepID=UPI0005CA7662|nr:hypothetical protein [Azospirillum sp. B4]
MERVVTGVTLQTFPQAVRRTGLRPGQRFTITVEDAPTDKKSALAKMHEISTAVSARTAAEGLTEEDIMRLLEEEDEEARNAK